MPEPVSQATTSSGSPENPIMSENTSAPRKIANILAVVMTVSVSTALRTDQVRERRHIAITSPPKAPTPAPAPAEKAVKDVQPAPVKPAPAPEKKVAAIPRGAYKVQIGSVSSEDQAGRLWNIQSGKSGGLLTRLSMHVERTVIKGKAYYRIQAGPLDSADSARKLCSQLKQRQVGCFVVHPKK